MTEYKIECAATTVPVYINQYGHLRKIRLYWHGTAADSKYAYWRICTKAGTNKWQHRITTVVANQVGFQDSTREFDVNIDIDRDDQIIVDFDFAAFTSSVFLDISHTKYARDRQFQDQLMGIHTGTT